MQMFYSFCRRQKWLYFSDSPVETFCRTVYLCQLEISDWISMLLGKWTQEKVVYLMQQNGVTLIWELSRYRVAGVPTLEGESRNG